MNEILEFTREEVEKMLMNITVLLDIVKNYLSQSDEDRWQVFIRRLLSTKCILESKYKRG